MTISWNPRTRIRHFFCKDWQLHIKSSSYDHLMKSSHKNLPFLLQQGLQDCHGSIEPRNDVLTDRSDNEISAVFTDRTFMSELTARIWVLFLAGTHKKNISARKQALFLADTWNPHHHMKSSHKNPSFLLQGLAITHKIVVLWPSHEILAQESAISFARIGNYT